MKIYKIYNEDEPKLVAEVTASGNVNGEGRIANNIRSTINNGGYEIVEGKFVDGGWNLLRYLSQRYDNGYYTSILTQDDLDNAYNIQQGEEKIKQSDEIDIPPEFREYVDSPEEAPEWANVEEGTETGVYLYDVRDNPNRTGQPSTDGELTRGEANERLIGDQYIGDNEEIKEIGDIGDLELGDDVIAEDSNGNLVRFETDSRFLEVGDSKWVTLHNPVTGESYAVDSSDVEGMYQVRNKSSIGGEYSAPVDFWEEDNVDSMRPIRKGVNNAQNVSFENGENAVYKPEHSWAHQEAKETDAFAYEVSTLMEDFMEDNFENPFPKTGVMDLGRGEGSVMEWVDGVEFSEKYMMTIMDLSVGDSRGGPLAMDIARIIRDNQDRFAFISFIDVLVDNTDRHTSNIMVDEDENFYAIDNGAHDQPNEEGEISERDFKAVSNLSYAADLSSPSEAVRKDLLDTMFDEVLDMHMNMLEEARENSEEILEIAQMIYGDDSYMLKRFKTLLEEDKIEDVKDRWEKVFEENRRNTKNLL